MLLLIPTPLSQGTPRLSVLQDDLALVRQCKNWLVETPKAARAALKTFDLPVPIRDLNMRSIKEIEPEELRAWLEKASADEPVGLISDAGCPAIADPGAEVVSLAQSIGCAVHPLVGPNSIVLGLMGSGLNGQNFHFWGYPPVQDAERDRWINQRELESGKNNTTQIVIETPFRNQKLFDALINTLASQTRLCVASDLTGERARVTTKHIAQWKERPLQLSKEPTLFLWLAPPNGR
ncbi:MAG: SAM-dependent methyltransferase [Limnobacter sp.]|nr:SAM-dependent methyltransferase [Limnobacter sp.]